MKMMIQKNKKSLALLLDPDKTCGKALNSIIEKAVVAGVDVFFAGGSLTFKPVEKLITAIKKKCDIPVGLFPGNLMQLTGKADFIMLLSLISGRNPDLLIGNHVIAAPFLKKFRHKVISTGYILIDGCSDTSVRYMSNTEPIPADKHDIAVATAIAGELLGMKMIYLEAGSGAASPVQPSVISAVRKNIALPLIVGGGLRSPGTVRETYTAGADMVVLGNGVEHRTALLAEAGAVRDDINRNEKEL